MERARSEAFLFFLLALACGVVEAGERVALHGSNATVEVPQGWTLAPVSSVPPTLVLNACDPATTDGCLVLAEMDFERLYAERAPASLEGLFRNASATDAEPGVSGNSGPPSWIEIAGHDAVETYSIGDVIYDYADGGSSTGKKAYRALTLKVGPDFYRCGISTSPSADVPRWRQALIEFCSSLQIADATSRTTGK